MPATRDLRSQAPLDDVVIEDEVLDSSEQRAAILRSNLRLDAPGSGELRMQEHPALQTDNAQHVRQGIHRGSLSR
jgi:hypothetical protein